jgi:flagellar basal-body rod protein FlgB
MNPVNLFDLASQQARWLSVRQSTVASNVANVNTPGFRTTDVEPFEQVLDKNRVAMATTHPTHIALGATKDQFAVREVTDKDAAQLPSDNTVVLEDEMLKANEIGLGYQLNTSIVKSFHRMMLMTTRS